MILAVEGPSATGKTTWCRSHYPEGFIAEAPEDIRAPDHYSDPVAAAHFWVECSVQRWQGALEMESRTGAAACDTDPLKLYYSWALWKSGALPSTLFDVEVDLYRQAIREGRLGFADRILWLEPPSSEELRHRAAADHTRRRRQHEIHLRLIPWMQSWFSARQGLALTSRYDVTGLDALLATLPPTRATST